jgi:hypothetical protein
MSLFIWDSVVGRMEPYTAPANRRKTFRISPKGHLFQKLPARIKHSEIS